jgi:hypothetical protein
VAPYDVVKSRGASVPGDPLPGVVTVQHWTPTGAPTPAARSTLRLTLRDVASVAVDLARAGFDGSAPVRVTVTTDGPATVIFGAHVVHLQKGTSTFAV